MGGGCARHVGTIATAECSQCGHGFCDDCVLHPFGPKKPPMCVACAMAFAGVTARGGRAPVRKLSRSERRRQRRLEDAPPALIA